MPSTAFLVRFLRDHYCGHPLRGLGEWLGSQEKIFAKQKRQTGEYPSRAAGDLYRDAQQIIAWLQQWTGTPLRAPQRTPGSDVGTVLAELRAWCAKTARTVGNGAGANGEAPETDPSTVEGSLTQAAEWLNMGPRRSRSASRTGSSPPFSAATTGGSSTRGRSSRSTRRRRLRSGAPGAGGGSPRADSPLSGADIVHIRSLHDRAQDAE